MVATFECPGCRGRIILEATGGSERQVSWRLWANASPVVVIHASPGRNVAQAAKPIRQDRPCGCGALLQRGKPTKVA